MYMYHFQGLPRLRKRQSRTPQNFRGIRKTIQRNSQQFPKESLETPTDGKPKGRPTEHPKTTMELREDSRRPQRVPKDGKKTHHSNQRSRTCDSRMNK